MPQIDITFFFNQVFYLILVFFLLMSYFAKDFLFVVSRVLSARVYNPLRLSKWLNYLNNFLFTSKFSKLSRISYYFDHFYRSLSAIKYFVNSSRSLFLASNDFVNAAYNDKLVLVLKSKYDLSYSKLKNVF